MAAKEKAKILQAKEVKLQHLKHLEKAAVGVLIAGQVRMTQRTVGKL